MAKVSNNKSSVRKVISSVKNMQSFPVVKECTIDFFYYDQGAEVEIGGEVKFDGNMNDRSLI